MGWNVVKGGKMLRLVTKVQCPECERVFDLLDETDADEYYYGHDCEDVTSVSVDGTVVAFTRRVEL